MKILIEIFMDGYKTEAEMFKACEEYVEDQLNSTAISAKILWKELTSPE